MEGEGVDAVVASGTEAGGHVGTVATLPLVPQVVDAVKIPVLAAGGIGDGRGFLAAFALGAQGIQMGTRFMATLESDLNDWGRNRLLEMRETDTIVTRAMTGATVRCIRTPEIAAYEDAVARGADAAELKDLAGRVRTSRYGEDRSDRRQYAAGQVAGMISEVVPVRALIENMLIEAARLAERLPSVLAGPTCDSIDVIAENLMLPELKMGDLIVGRAMGAYTWASASEFNFFPKATVVTVNAKAGDMGSVVPV